MQDTAMEFMMSIQKKQLIYTKNNGIYDEGDSKGKVGLTTWVKMGLPVKLFNNDKFLTSVVVLKIHQL